MTTKKEAAVEMATKVELAMALIKEAEALADEHGLDFSINVAYGMGGWYTGKRNQEDWDSSAIEAEENYGWSASSQSC